jgi:hypothetical protein
MSFPFCETHNDYHKTFLTPPTICPTARAATPPAVDPAEEEPFLEYERLANEELAIDPAEPKGDPMLDDTIYEGMTRAAYESEAE